MCCTVIGLYSMKLWSCTDRLEQWLMMRGWLWVRAFQIEFVPKLHIIHPHIPTQQTLCMTLYPLFTRKESDVKVWSDEKGFLLVAFLKINSLQSRVLKNRSSTCKCVCCGILNRNFYDFLSLMIIFFTLSYRLQIWGVHH